jgi:hypothetical protein
MQNQTMECIGFTLTVAGCCFPTSTVIVEPKRRPEIAEHRCTLPVHGYGGRLMPPVSTLIVELNKAAYGRNPKNCPGQRRKS